MVGLNHLETIQAKLEACRKGLQRWSKNIDRDRAKAIKERSKALNQLQRDEGPRFMNVQK